MGWIVMTVKNKLSKNKQNSSVNFSVRAEFLSARPSDHPPASGDHYTQQS